MFRAHVEATFESSHGNGPPGHKCQEMHGHSWVAEIDFSYDTDALDAYGWGPDFGAVKAFIHALDHHDLNILLAPVPPSAENIARHLWDAVDTEFPQTYGLLVTIHEGRGNQITYDGQD